MLKFSVYNQMACQMQHDEHVHQSLTAYLKPAKWKTQAIEDKQSFLGHRCSDMRISQ